MWRNKPHSNFECFVVAHLSTPNIMCLWFFCGIRDRNQCYFRPHEKCCKNRSNIFRFSKFNCNRFNIRPISVPIMSFQRRIKCRKNADSFAKYNSTETMAIIKQNHELCKCRRRHYARLNLMRILNANTKEKFSSCYMKFCPAMKQKLSIQKWQNVGAGWFFLSLMICIQWMISSSFDFLSPSRIWVCREMKSK